MKYMESLREGERISEVYLCKYKQSALTKSGKPYDNVILQDKTGTIDAKIWDPGSVGIEEFDSLDYVAVTGDITSFQGNLQLSIKRLRKVGGLLEHTLSVAKNCDYFSTNYPFLNRDLLITAAIFHDVGKLRELSVFPENDYTDEGQLLGHIMIGAEWVGEEIRKIDGFPVVLGNELKHCILAHHGELEYGSPKKPALVEALALSFADNIDAKMETFKELLANVPDKSTEWQGFNRLLETNIRRTSD